MIYPSMVFSFIIGRIRIDSGSNDPSRYVLTHLQKFSPFGFMVTWPFCFHFWLFWKLQEFMVFDDRDLNYSLTITWKRGTERGIYFRTPGYRWDADLGMKWTWGYIGGHWD